jgi:hypothetical protein
MDSDAMARAPTSVILETFSILSIRRREAD